tara:strand:+ start:5495 stop:7936 length:2442 start_codon:yes stop_codon:yes gene_type:complete
MNVKKVFSFSGFPNHLATDAEKNTDTFGLQMLKAIEKEWMYRPENGACSYYDKRDKYHNLRLYARGEQSSKKYKELINGGEGSSYTNYDWTPIQVVPKFLNLIVNQMTERLFNIRAEAVDKYSTDLKDKRKGQLEHFLHAKPAMLQAKKILNVDIMPSNAAEMPSTQEEIDLYMKLKYKPAIEIACEEAIKHTLKLNDYPEIQTNVLEDVATIGLGVIKHGTDVNKGITVEYVDPANMVHSYPTHNDFKDVHYYGEVKRITITELQRISGSTFTTGQLKNMAAATSEWTNYHGFNSDQQNYREDDISGTMVDVLFGNFKSTNTLSYKKKHSANKGFKMTKKGSDFKKKDPNYKGYDVVKKTIDVWYEGALVLGTEHIFNYKLCENMIRPEGNINRTLPNYLIYAPELYQNRTKSLIERIIPYVDLMQQVHIKIQQFIAKARPNGIFIDLSGFEEIDMGGGNFLTPMEVIKIYDETGNVLGASVTDEGNYNNGKSPIVELHNGVIDGIDRLIMSYNHYLNQLRDAIGIPQGSDASMPHPDTLVGVQQQVANSSNVATRHVLNSVLNITQRLGLSLGLRLKDIFEYSDLKEAYISAIGKINVKTLEAIKEYSLYDLGIHIELKPDGEEKGLLEQNIQIALGKELITLDDSIDIRNVDNIKLANELLKVKRINRERAKKEHEKEMLAIQGESQAKAAQATAQSAQQTMSMKTQGELAVVQAKSQAKMAEFDKEAQVKMLLMEKEFLYNMTLKGVEVDGQMGKEKFKEDEKGKRQDRNNSQASKMIDQRAGNKKPINFESGLDNVSGEFGISDHVPS